MSSASEVDGHLAGATTLSGFVVLGPHDRLVAAGGPGDELWAAHRSQLQAIARRASAGRPSSGELRHQQQAWQVTATQGRGPDGAPVVLLSLTPERSQPWAARSTLDEERHESLRRLVAGMVHELRNPLASISLTAELAGYHAGLPNDLREKLGDIVHHVERAEEVLGCLRRLGREIQGTLRLYSTNDLVQDAARLERVAAGSRGIEIRLDLDPTVPQILADPSQLRIAIANLIRNGAEAMGAGGDGACLTVRSSHRHGVVRLVVDDEGPGIPPELLHRIFEREFTTKESGSGLGLAIANGIVKAHGGHIWAENRRRRGASFIIDLPDPSYSTPARQPGALGLDFTQGPTQSALVVGEAAAGLEMVRTAIAAIGWKVQLATTREVALRKLRAADFDALLVIGRPDFDAALDVCARAVVVQPGLAGRIGVLLGEDPTVEQAERLRRAGLRASVGAAEGGPLQSFARALAGSGAGTADRGPAAQNPG